MIVNRHMAVVEHERRVRAVHQRKKCAVTICFTAVAPFAEISAEIECHELGLGIFDPLN